MFKSLPITHPLDLIIELAISNPDFSVYSPSTSVFRPSDEINLKSSTGIRPADPEPILPQSPETLPGDDMKNLIDMADRLGFYLASKPDVTKQVVTASKEALLEIVSALGYELKPKLGHELEEVSPEEHKRRQEIKDSRKTMVVSADGASNKDVRENEDTAVQLSKFDKLQEYEDETETGGNDDTTVDIPISSHDVEMQAGDKNVDDSKVATKDSKSRTDAKLTDEIKSSAAKSKNGTARR